jgi:drug/metabolite transporter (DMT)-like permease
MFLFSSFDFISLGYGGTMATIDALTLSALKAFHIGWISWSGTIIIAMIIYALQPLLFLQSLQFQTLTVMNLLRDLMSDILVTSIGLFYFSEKLSIKKKMGVILSIVSILLFSWKEDHI